jgi:spermidine synthase
MQGIITYENGSAFLEEAGPANTSVRYKLKEVLHTEQSPYQLIEVADSVDFGRMLILDGCVNVCERDEAVYHEMIAHLPVLIHPNPLRILVIGGGDGGTVRQLIRHRSIERIDVAEIDAAVIDASTRFFPDLACSFSDPRVNIYTEDGTEFVKRANAEAYSIVIVDSSDPTGPAEGLYSSEFYEHCQRILNPAGIVVAQAESPYVYPSILKLVHGLICDIFGSALPYRIAMPTYPSGQLYFMLGSKRRLVPPYFNDSRLEMFFCEQCENLRFLSADMLGGVFVIPVEVSDLLTR